MSDPRSNWTNPVLWLLWGLPLVSVIAGVGLVIVANRDPHAVSTERVQRTGQIQLTDLGPDALAQRRSLSAVLRVGGGAVEVIPVQGDFDRSAALRASLVHPTRSTDDRVLTLHPTAIGWRVVHEVSTAGEWNVRLEPMDGRWRILGRLPKHQQAVLLQPALSAAD